MSVTASGGSRTISLYNIHTKETVSVLYKKDGRYVPDALQKLNHILRDHRRNEATSMDPALIDLIWEMHHELGSKQPVHIISGYRSRATNEMLRSTQGGQASQSRHILGKAADVHFPDVEVRKLRYSALVRERGGVGYYPTSAIPFIHVDTDRVRSWPRLPRHELALLFPGGRTQHLPADGGSIDGDDVRQARQRHSGLAADIAEFHDLRRSGQRKEVLIAESKPAAPVSDRRQLASASPPAAREPRLVEPLAPASIRQISAPSSGIDRLDRDRLNELFTLASGPPQLVAEPKPARRSERQVASLGGVVPPLSGLLPARRERAGEPKTAGLGLSGPVAGPLQSSPEAKLDRGMSWAAAPAFDEEHPDELSYRPFPISPFLTSSIDEPVMAEFLPLDMARTLDFLDHHGSTPPLRFRGGLQTASLLWSQQFTGSAIGLAKLYELQWREDERGSGSPADLRRRNVAVGPAVSGK